MKKSIAVIIFIIIILSQFTNTVKANPETYGYCSEVISEYMELYHKRYDEYPRNKAEVSREQNVSSDPISTSNGFIGIQSCFLDRDYLEYQFINSNEYKMRSCSECKWTSHKFNIYTNTKTIYAEDIIFTILCLIPIITLSALITNFIYASYQRNKGKVSKRNITISTILSLISSSPLILFIMEGLTPLKTYSISESFRHYIDIKLLLFLIIIMIVFWLPSIALYITRKKNRKD